MPVPLPAQRLERPAFDLRKEAERLILERHSPPAFVVDSELHIIHFQGNTAPYLKPMSGEPSFHLLKILRPELTLEIRTAISDANRELKPVRHEGVRLERDGHGGAIDIEVIPITGRQEKRPDFLVVLHQAPKVVQERGQRGTAGRLRKQQEAEETARLRQELAATQDYLRSLVEDSEATTEELRAANEEILSSNEELQSANEELETAKEELQAGNEELLTLNEELQNRNSELRQALSDVNNLLNWVEIPIVILGRDLRIRRFTAAAGEILNLIPADLGRPLTHIRSDVLLPDLEPLAKSVFEDMRPIEREVADAQGHWYALRMVPYKVQNDKVEGVLVTLVDIDDLKRSYAAVVETMREPLLVLDSSAFRVSTANPAFCEKFREKPSEVENHILFELEQWNIPAIREMLQAATMNREATKTIELDHVFPRIGRKIMLFHATPLFRSGIRVHKVLVVIEDMTEQREAEAALRRNEQKLREVAAQQIGLLERENQKVSMMLHDSFSQKLALLMIALERLQRQLPADPDIVKQELRKLAEEVSGLDREIHQLAQEVYPALLRELGLEMALKKECEAFGERYGITMKLASVAIPELPPEADLCLFRIAQESMLNIAKHAGVKEGTITLTANDRSVMLTVEDMGKGYDVEEARGKTGLGLIGMEERARLLGCKLSVQSKPGSGTRIVVEVPLKREATEAMQRSDKG